MHTAPPSQRGLILVVDDQQENVRIVSSVLKQCQYDIMSATGAEEACARLQEATPDIILLDVMMPDTDGLTACRRIKENPKWAEIPVIFLSAADDKNVIVQALDAGGVDYVTKPFNRAELVSRVRTHMALKHARDSQRRLAEDKDELLGMMAHDLKNGLAGIQLSSSLLAERAAELPPRCGTLASNICATSNRLLEHLQDFLANQRAGELQVNCLPLDPGVVLRKVIGQNEAAAAAKDISLTLATSDGNALASADQEALVQILDNLLTNAIKFTPPGGQVEAAIRPAAGGDIAIHIADSGPGFSEGDLQLIFRRYQRLSARPTGNEPSSGLGLSIARKLARLLRGDLEVSTARSHLGGAEFILTLQPASC